MVLEKIYKICMRLDLMGRGFVRFLLRLSSQEDITNIFDYNEIIRNRPDNDSRILFSNRYYGMSYILKKYSGFKKTINTAIEHAPGLDIDMTGEYKIPESPSTLVCATQRKNYLREKSDKPIWAIGPSIHYAESILSDFYISAMKDALGKTLLVYPLHDIEDFHYLQDTESFIKYVKSIQEKYGYKTVLVSMYFVDIERGRHLAFQKEGWTIVSAGRRENYDFNNIMKAIIKLADYAIFQAYASALGYCVYLKVPVTIWHQPFLFVENGVEKKQTDNGIKPGMMQELEDMFSDYSEQITKEQYNFCNYWFGYDDVKKPEELRLLLDYISRIKPKMTKKQLLKIASRKKYSNIKEIIQKGIY